MTDKTIIYKPSNLLNMTRFDIFAKPIGSSPENEFLALHNYSGDLETVKGLAASRGCEITRIYDLSKPLEKPNFINTIKLQTF